MPRRCSCFGCRGNYDGTPYVKVISFPKDPEERERWILAMPNEKESLRHLKEIYICETHFNCEWVSVKGGKRPKEPPSRFPGIPKSVFIWPDTLFINMVIALVWRRSLVMKMITRCHLSS